MIDEQGLIVVEVFGMARKGRRPAIKHRSGNKCRGLPVAAVARPQGVYVLANVTTTLISRTMLNFYPS